MKERGRWGIEIGGERDVGERDMGERYVVERDVGERDVGESDVGATHPVNRGRKTCGIQDKAA